MKPMVYVAIFCFIGLAGCSSQSSNANTEGGDPKAAKTNDKPNQAAEIRPAAGESKEVALSPENTKIQFVGNHTGDDPKPRTGTFSKFKGKATINQGQLKSLNVDIETSSLTTDIEKLTNHLKSPDFFDVREHPKATFQSTAIEVEGDQQVKITGDLTLLGVIKSVSFPATVSIEDDLSLKGDFKIDRTQFGMDYGTDNVEKDVEMTVTVGK